MVKKGRMIGAAEAKAIRARNKSAFKRYQSSRPKYFQAEVNKSSWDYAKKLLMRFPFEMQLNVVRKSGRAAAIIVRETANTMLDMGSVPRGPDEGAFPGNSKETGTFHRKSQDQQDARDGRPSMVNKVGIKEKRYRNKYLHMIGPRRPWGNQAWILEWGGVIQLWGTGKYYHLKPRPFMEPAGNNTKAVQKNAYIKKMKLEWANW